MVATVELEDLARAMAADLKGQHFGSTRILEASATIDHDSSEEVAVFLDLTLTNPHGETWPEADILALYRRSADEASSVGLTLTVYLRLAPETEEAEHAAEDDDSSFPRRR